MINQFITVEGIEGVGKTTVCQTIYQFFHQHKFPIIQTREPGGTPIGEAIRQVILNDYPHDMDPLCELLLMFAARAQHIKQVIKPALAQKEWVLSDRFTDASYAYQGAGRDLGFDKVATLEQLVQAELRPGLTLLLDAPVDVALGRMVARGKLDRIEQENQDFFQRIRDGYLQRAQQDAARYRIVDASQPLSEVHAAVKQILSDYVGEAHDLA